MIRVYDMVKELGTTNSGLNAVCVIVIEIQSEIKVLSTKLY